MTIKYLHILLFILAASTVFCQTDFKVEELENFVTIYMSVKNEKQRNTVADRLLFEQYGMSQQRYRQIAKAALTNASLSLSPNEEKLFERIKQENEDEKERREGIVFDLCVQYDLPKSVYDTILKRYYKEIAFQRSLKPYFDTYIKSLK